MEYYSYYNSSVNIFYLAVSLLTSLFLIKLFTSSGSNNKKQLAPSPPPLPILGHLHLLKKPLHRALARVSSAHGPVVLLRFGSRPVLVVSSLPAAEECFTKNDVAFANRPRLPSMTSLTYNCTTLASAPYGPHWRRLRHIATVELFSSARIHSLSDARRCEADSMVVNLFKESCSSDDRGAGVGRGQVDCTMEKSMAPPLKEDDFKFKEVELKPRLYALALNVMMRMISGRSYDNEEGSDEVERFRELVEESLAVIGGSNVSDFLPALRWVDFGGVKKRVRRLVEKREILLQGLIDEMRQKKGLTKTEEEKKSSVLEVLLSLQEEEPEHYTDEIIKAMMVTLFSAGTDSSTDTIEWAMTLLVNHPRILQKARDEIDSLVEASRLLREDDLPNLPCLQAIVNETLRLCPAVPLLAPHESLEECSVGGYRIPRGTMLLVNAWAIHRDPRMWEDPTEFRPERFLGGGRGDGGRIIPFGMGRRRCPGDALATRMVGLVLGSLIQCFEWERIGTELVDMEEGGGLTLHKVHPLRVMYRPRRTMIDVLSRIRSI